jgi:membrane protease YdiL (CAAX protease family)
VKPIKTIFWNRDQRRLRALWRLLLQIILLILVTVPLQAAVGFVAVGLLIVGGDVLPDLTGLPDAPPGALDPQAVQDYLLQSPLLLTLSSLALLVSITVSVWLAGRFLDHRRFADFGLHLDRDWWIDFGFGLLLGALLMLAIFVVESAAGWVKVTGTFVTKVPGTAFPVAILSPLLVFICVGFYEELFSRGYQLKNLSEGLYWGPLGPRGAIAIAALLSSLLFGLLHATNPYASAGSTFNIGVAGLLLATGALLTGELAIPIGLHIGWNFFQGNVFGFPVSGGNVRAATFIGIQQAGPDLWTGGAFGPEAGLLGLWATLIGILLTVLWVSWRYGAVGLDLTLASAPDRPEHEA